MRTGRIGVGGIVGLAGAIFFLQGVGLLPGSFMTGSAIWAVIGAVLIVGGGLLISWGIRPSR